jgi:uncharacterized protein
MQESRVTMERGEQTLEGLFAQGSLKGAGGVICHPHPLYGGDMDNGVVSTLQRILHRFGCSTLRFNFRGVGRSSGVYGDGEGEVEDLQAAVSYLDGHGLRQLHLAGYSFGAWIALKACHAGLQPASLILVSPPLDFLRFDGLQLPSCPSLITGGDRDEFCRKDSLLSWVSRQSTAPEVISHKVLPGCDHFYWGKEAILSAEVAEFLANNLKAGSA